MSSYNPPAFPRRPLPKQRTFLSEVKFHCELAYYQYQVNTPLYVMSPGEKLAFNLIVFSFFALFVTAVVYYLPAAVLAASRRLVYYIFGNSLRHATAPSTALKVGTGGLEEGVRARMSEASISLTDVVDAIAMNASATFR